MEKLRFKQEDGTDYPEWEESALGDFLVPVRYERVENPEEHELLTVKLHGKGVKRTGAKPNKTENGRPYYKRQEGELLIGRQNVHNGGFGLVGSDESGLICSNAIGGYSAPGGTEYFFQFLSSIYPSLEKYTEGTGAKEIPQKAFHALKFNFPSLPEQEKIATFLGSLDERIEAQRVLVSGLEQEKRGYMQAMLSPTPTLRFKQDDGTEYPDWEYRRLDAITSFRMGFTPSTGDSSLWDGDHEWLSIAGLGDKKYVDSGNKRISDRAVSGKAPFPKGTLIMSFKLSIGKLGITRSDIYTNEAICGFENLDTFSTEYLYYALANTDVKSFGSRAVKGITLNSESLGGISLPFPSIPEQERIATFLGLLDHRLEVEKDILSNMEQEKRGFAQRLFL